MMARCSILEGLALPASIVTALLATSAAAEERKPPNLNDLSWIAGSWSVRNNGEDVEEHWLAPKGGIMLGMNRTTRDSGKTSFEFLRIGQTDRGIVYFASPQGRPPTEFLLKELGEQKVVFENLKNPFPQRIAYWREGDDTLVARIEGEVGGKSRSAECRWQRTNRAAK